MNQKSNEWTEAQTNANKLTLADWIAFPHYSGTQPRNDNRSDRYFSALSRKYKSIGGRS